MFDSEYNIKGYHAILVKEILDVKLNKNENRIFRRNFDIFRLAPLVGFRLGIKKDEIKSTKDESTIGADIIVRKRDELLYYYQLITLADKEFESDVNARIDAAFKHVYNDESKEINKKYFKNYEDYMRGGIEKLHECIVLGIHSDTEVLQNILELFEGIDSRNNIEKYENDDYIKDDMLTPEY